MNNTDEHKIITAFDIYKDAKKFNKPSVKPDKDGIVYEAISEIISKKKNLTQIKKEYEDFKKKELLSTDIILKTPITSLEAIDEKTSSSLNSVKNAIIRIKPKILTGEKYLFYDAGTHSKDFCKSRDSCKYCETIASYIDPASRPTEDVIFINTHDLNVSNRLSECGIGNDGTQIKYIHDSLKEDNKREIKFTLEFKYSTSKEIILTATIDKYGKLLDVEIIPNNIDKTQLNNLFKGNHKKNEHINDNSVHYTPVELLFILCKELGDTYQAIILKQLISDQIHFKMYNITNTCLTTNDTVLFLRSKLLKIPVLLYNDGLVRYYPSSSHKEILRQDLEDEIINVIKTNQNTVIVLQKIINGNFKVEIPHEEQYKLKYNDDNVKQHLQDLINNITIVNKFLEGLQKYIENKEGVSRKLTFLPSLKSIKEAHIDSINKTYGTIISIPLETIDEANLQSIKKKINAFKSLFIKEYSSPEKFVINFNTKTIFSNTLILLEKDTNLYKIINESCFFKRIPSGKRMIQFKEWVQNNRTNIGGGDFSPEYEKMDVSPPQLKKPDSFNKLASPVTSVDIKSFIFLYEHLYIYINCYPKLLYKFLDKDYLKKFIEFNSKRRVIEINQLIKKYFNLLDYEQLLDNEQLYQLNYQTQATDNDDKVITEFLYNLESLLEENPNLYFNEDNIILGSSRSATRSKSYKSSKKKKKGRDADVVLTRTKINSKREARKREKTPYGKGKTQKKKPIKKKNKTKP